jgi:hypothetical protein
MDYLKRKGKIIKKEKGKNRQVRKEKRKRQKAALEILGELEKTALTW